MALARVKTWNPGDTLTAADLNGEFNNILNNPISLLSPTTGAINFQTSVAHTNLQVSALTASSGFAGSVLVGSTAATPSPVWSTGAVSGGLFVATTASIPTWLAVGSSGQLLLAASSGAPAYSTGMNFVTTARELYVQRVGAATVATALTSANFSISSGWGSTAVIQNIRGFDQAYQFQILTGSTMVGNPTVTTTYADGLWPNIPMSICALTGGTGINSTAVVHTISVIDNSSGQILQMFFTPSAGLTYTYQVINFG